MDNEKEEKFENDKKRIEYDVSIKNENSLFYSIFNNEKDYVLIDKLSENEINSKSTVIRFNFICMDTPDRYFKANFHAKSNSSIRKINYFIPKPIYDKVKTNNFVNFHTFYRIRGDFPFIEFSDLTVQIDIKDENKMS